MYRIGELARLSQVPIRTLRYYHQIGVLVPTEHAPSGYLCSIASRADHGIAGLIDRLLG
jgi:hypothetical protein